MARQSMLRVAVIGAGRMGADHVRRIQEVTSGARVTAVVDVDAERAKAVAARVDGCTAYTDPVVAMAAADVDAVLVASPGPAHEAALLAAFARDLPVLCEKPLTPDAASALRVLEAEQKLGRRRVQVGFMRRYDAEYTRLARLLGTGQLGRPLLVHHRHRNLASPPGWTSDMLITDSVAHEIDVTRWLLGQEITAVTVLRPSPTANAPDDLQDPQFVVLETADGAIAELRLRLPGPGGGRVRARHGPRRRRPRHGHPHGGPMGRHHRPGLPRTLRGGLRPRGAGLGRHHPPRRGHRPQRLGRLRRGRRLRGRRTGPDRRRPYRGRTGRTTTAVRLTDRRCTADPRNRPRRSVATGVRPGRATVGPVRQAQAPRHAPVARRRDAGHGLDGERHEHTA
jgi:myo-inositol 2-dehydrogenase/D-chiro-inositol 1-dehydrogenase